MRMPVLADIRKTQQELTLALAELDSIEAAVVAQNSSQPPSDSVQLRERVEFLQQENRELAQVSHTGTMLLSSTNKPFIVQRNDEFVVRFDKVHSEKEKLKNDIEELRAISQKLQIDVGKVNEEKTLLSAIVKNTQGNNSRYLKVFNICLIF